MPVPLPWLAIERASGSVSDTCPSGVLPSGPSDLKSAHLILQRRDPLLQTHGLAEECSVFLCDPSDQLLEVLGDALLDQVAC